MCPFWGMNELKISDEEANVGPLSARVSEVKSKSCLFADDHINLEPDM